MSIKTKKINDLSTIEVSSAAAMEKMNFVASNETGLTGKVSGADFVSMISNAIEGATMSLVENMQSKDDLEAFEKELTSVKKTLATATEKTGELQTRVADLESKFKTLSNAHSQLSIDTSNHILEVKGQVEKLMEVFQTLATEEKLTLAKIQEASKTLFPVVE